MLRIVLDTSVLVSAFRNRNGSSYELLRLVGEEAVVALASTSLFLEYESVLTRPEQLSASRLRLEDMNVALRSLALLLRPVEVWYKWRPQLSDANDDMVLEVVVNGRADVLVTFNLADFEVGARQFGFKMLTPTDMLREIK